MMISEREKMRNTRILVDGEGKKKQGGEKNSREMGNQWLPSFVDGRWCMTIGM